MFVITMKLVLMLISLIDLSYSAEWSYDREDLWHGVCATGKQQSPINILSGAAVVRKQGPLQFRGYDNVQVAAMNNGHTIKWKTNEGSPRPVLSGGPLRGNYSLIQFHLHWDSEHAIDGLKYPLEIHLVHIKNGLTLKEALNVSDGLAVIGVLCQVAVGSHVLDEIIALVPKLIHQTERDVDAGSIDISRLLSPDPQSYYTYHGSLTTPDCSEVVTWIVMDRPLHIADYHYKTLRKVDVGGATNFRSLQPTQRLVYRSVASCSSLLAPTYIGFISSLISCLAANFSAVISKSICVVGNAKRRVFGEAVWCH